MKKLIVSMACGGLLAAIAAISPARGQVPPPPPPPNGGTALPTIGLPCPPTGCPTNTPTITPTATATLTPTATATATPTNTPIPLFIQTKLAHSTVKAGKTQKIVVTTVPGTPVKIVLSYPNHTKKTHTGTANANGKLSWTYKQPKNKATSKNRTVKVSVTVHDASTRHTSHKRYKIG